MIVLFLDIPVTEAGLIITLFHHSRLKQACNGTLQDQRRRWNEQALLPSANVPEPQVSYFMINQNQHKKENTHLKLFAARCIVIQGSGFYGILIEGARADGQYKAR